ncbi:hypothetical protein BCEP4_550015 [Burkholderia cepacia]|nr:hypothetical protein BCEP4_550015 [Burkholderia cepacia]
MKSFMRINLNFLYFYQVRDETVRVNDIFTRPPVLFRSFVPAARYAGIISFPGQRSCSSCWFRSATRPARFRRFATRHSCIANGARRKSY